MPEKIFSEDGLVAAEDYTSAMNNHVLPFIRKYEEEIRISGFGEKQLFCVRYRNPEAVGTVVLVHGFTENAFKYAELICSLLKSGFSVVAYDQRGHGRSWRSPSVTNMSVTHIDDFNEYLADLEIVINTVTPVCEGPLSVFAHSMGGAVAALFLESHPDTFSRAVLCAPMIAPNVGGLPAFIPSMICKTASVIGHSSRKVFFMKPYSGHEDFATSCATDKARFYWYDNIKFETPFFQNSIPTYSWVSESIKVTDKILAPGMPERISCPVLLFTADDDSSVMPEPQKKFIERVRNGSHVFVPSSRHEIFRSENSVLFPWWNSVLRFLRGEKV